MKEKKRARIKSIYFFQRAEPEARKLNELPASYLTKTFIGCSRLFVAHSIFEEILIL